MHDEVKLTGAGNMLTKGCLTSGLRRDVLLYIPPCSSLSPLALLFHNHLISLPSTAALAAEQMFGMIAFSVANSCLHATMEVTEVQYVHDQLRDWYVL